MPRWACRTPARQRKGSPALKTTPSGAASTRARAGAPCLRLTSTFARIYGLTWPLLFSKRPRAAEGETPNGEPCLSPLFVSLLSFVTFVASSLFGLWLARTLPEEQISDRNRDLIKEARRMLVALASLTLGLIIASATASFDQRSNELEESASKIIALDSTLAKYGPPAREGRELLRGIVKRGIDRVEIAATEGFNTDKTRKGIGINKLQLKLLELSPQNERENWLRATALSLSNDLGAFRWLKYSGSDGRIQWPFLAILIFWLCGVFVSYGVVSPPNAMGLGTMTVVALAMAMAIHLTLDLDTPNRGLISMSAAPLQLAFDQIGPLEPASPPRP